MRGLFLYLFIGLVLGLLGTNAIAATSSIDGTNIPGSTQILDTKLNIWTVTSGKVYENAKPAGFTTEVSLLLYLGGVIYQENSAKKFWSWSGSAWVGPVADPRGVSASGSAIPTATRIIDSKLNVWAVVSGRVYANGKLAGFTENVIQLLYQNALIYQENTAKNFWSWSGTAWTGPVANPVRAPASIPPCAEMTISVPTGAAPTRAFVNTNGIQIPLLAKGQATGATTCTMSAQTSFSDVNGVPQSTSAQTFTISTSFATAITLKPSVKNFGYYNLATTFSSSANKDLTSYKTSIGVLMPLGGLQVQQASINSPFGVNVHFDQGKGDINVIPKLMKLAGIRWERDTITWSDVERTKGQYAISQNLLNAYKQLQANDIEMLGVLAYGNPLYTSQPEPYGDYAAYVAKTLKGTIDHFEIWNEPQTFGALTPTEYLTYLESAYPKIKAANPDAFVVSLGGASPGGTSAAYDYGPLKIPVAQNSDTFSMHTYTTPFTADVGYKTTNPSIPIVGLGTFFEAANGLPQEIQTLHRLAAPPGIWITEMGFPTTSVTPIVQAQQTARAYIMAAAYPEYAKIFIYDFLCDGTSTTDAEDNFGLVNYDYSIRPSYVAVATTTHSLEGRPFIKKLDFPNDAAQVFLFGPADDPLVVGWLAEIGPSELAQASASNTSVTQYAHAGSRPASYNQNVQLKIQPSSGVSSRDWQNQTASLSVNGGVVTINLTTSPKFVIGVGSASNITPLP